MPRSAAKNGENRGNGKTTPAEVLCSESNICGLSIRGYEFALAHALGRPDGSAQA
jgi:hypothetical protein